MVGPSRGYVIAYVLFGVAEPYSVRYAMLNKRLDETVKVACDDGRAAFVDRPPAGRNQPRADGQ